MSRGVGLNPHFPSLAFAFYTIRTLS
jgi:hypothetical protein